MSVIRVRLDLTDRLVIGGIPMRPIQETLEGHVLCHVDNPKVHVAVSHAELATLQKREDFRYAPEYFGAKRAETRLVSGVEELIDSSRASLLLTARMYGWAADFLELERKQAQEPKKPRSERISRSDAGMRRAIERILAQREAGRKDAREEAPGAGASSDPMAHRKRRFGSDLKKKSNKKDEDTEKDENTGKDKDTTPKEWIPCVRSFRKYVLLLEQYGSADVMRPRTDVCGCNAPRVSLACEMLMAEVAARYMSETRPTKASLYLDLKLRVADAAKAAAEAGFGEVIEVPSRRTFYSRINALPAYQVHAARFGLKAAEKKFGSVTMGLDAKRPGQFVIIDEFRVPMQTILVKSGAWQLMTAKERKACEKLRPWVCVALDAATRVILGMSISREQSTSSVLATLRMVMSDKGPYADAVGALSSWDMALRPEVVMTDAGSTFISDPVRAALAGLRIGNSTGAASRPMLRALIERVFGTIHTQLLCRFTGRTFANVVQKGDYDAEDRASLTPEDLCWALPRYAVDVYHNSPHEGLDGETPANYFRRLSQLYPPTPVPDLHTMRSVFGFDIERRSGPRGVRVLGLYYQGHALQEHRRAYNDGKVTVRVDPMNMGGVSVLLDGAWMPLHCATRNLDGVTLREWIATATALRNRHARDAKITEPLLLDAIRAIQELSERRIEMVGLGDVRPSQRMLELAERNLDIGWIMPGSEFSPADGTDIAIDPFAESVATTPDVALDVATEASGPQTSAASGLVRPRRSQARAARKRAGADPMLGTTGRRSPRPNALAAQGARPAGHVASDGSAQRPRPGPRAVRRPTSNAVRSRITVTKDRA